MQATLWKTRSHRSASSEYGNDCRTAAHRPQASNDATRDIGEAAASALLNLDFRQKQTRELLGQRDISMSEAAQIIGKNIGKPDLRYTQAPDEQVRPALIQLGMSPNMANLLLEMSAALNSGYMRALEPRLQKNTTPTSYETFVAEEFVPLYEGKSQRHSSECLLRK